jgi:hypothetical protein
MDFGQQRLIQQQNARNMMYQNSGYQFERRDKKTLIIDVADTATVSPLSHATEFSIPLFEPLIIDKLSDVYLDSFLTHNSTVCHTGDKMAFALKINEFNVNSNVASFDTTATRTVDSKQHIYNSILIPNEHNSTTDVHSCVVHKGKKMNYVCSINAGTISTITGKITDLVGLSMYNELSAPTTNADGGKLHYVKLTTGASQHVPKGSLFGWTAGTDSTTITNFSVAFNMDEGATDLYFYSNGGTLDSLTGVGLGNIEGLSAALGLRSKVSDVSTYQLGDSNRFIAEFVIVARE